MIFNFLFGGSKEKPLPPLSNPGVEADLRKGKQLINGNRKVVNGSMPNVALAEPTITVNKTGQITATVTQNSNGYISSGTKNATKKLSSSDDPNFIASNIKSGVKVFGITGTAKVRDTVKISVANDTSRPLTVYTTDANGEVIEIDVPKYDVTNNIESALDGIVLLDIGVSDWEDVFADSNLEIVTKQMSSDFAVLVARGDGDITVR